MKPSENERQEGQPMSDMIMRVVDKLLKCDLNLASPTLWEDPSLHQEALSFFWCGQAFQTLYSGGREIAIGSLRY